MSNPQLENGYVSIANEIVEMFARWQFSSYEQRVLWVVIRKTYGWHKKEDWVSLSQFCSSTGLLRPHVCRALKMLTMQNIITKRGTTYSPLYSLQKDFDKWKPLPKGVRTHTTVPKGVMGSTKRGNQVVPKGVHTKETITKETIQKKEEATTLQGDRFSLEGAEILKAFESVDPKNKTYYNRPPQREACDFLIKEYGKDKVLWVVQHLPIINKNQFVKKTYTPYQLKENWQSIKDHLEGIKIKKNSNIAFT